MVLVPGEAEARLQLPAATVPVQLDEPSDTVTLPVGVPLEEEVTE